MVINAINSVVYNICGLFCGIFSGLTGIDTPMYIGKPEAVKEPEISRNEPIVDPEVVEDAVKALNSLGMTKTRAKQVVTEITNESPDATIEQIIKTALKRKK